MTTHDSNARALRFDVFGRRVLVARSAAGWSVFYLGSDGKRRPAGDIRLPSDIPEAEIGQYLGDICHEWASERYPVVVRLD